MSGQVHSVVLLGFLFKIVKLSTFNLWSIISCEFGGGCFGCPFESCKIKHIQTLEYNLCEFGSNIYMIQPLFSWNPRSRVFSLCR
jgi:hypothetical protein